MRAARLLMAGLAVCLFNTSCATVAGLKADSADKKTYVGTSTDLEIIGGLGDYYDFGEAQGWLLFSVGLVDLPLSFVADTVLLPYTVIRDVRRNRKERAEATGSQAGE